MSINLFIFNGLVVNLTKYYYGWITKKIIERQEPIQVRYMDDETVEGKLIGKVGNTLFLLDGDFVRVIPLDGVVKEMNWPLSAE